MTVVSYRLNGGDESSGGSGPGASSTDVSVTQLRDSSGGTVSAGDSANQAVRVNVVAGSAGSTIVSVANQVRVIASSAADLNVTVAGYVAPSTTVSVANQVRVTASSAADLVATIGAVSAGAGRLNIGSTAADNAVLATIGSNLQSSAVVAANSSALNVRVVGGVSSAVDFQARVNQGSANSSAGDAWVITPVAGSTFNVRPLQSSAADLQATVTPAAGSTFNVRPLQSSAADLQATVTPAAGSTFNVRPLQSSAADLNASVQPIAGSTWRTQPGSTAWASSAGFHFDSSGALQAASYLTNNAGVAVETSTRATNSTAVGLITRQANIDSTYASGKAASSGDQTVLSSAAGVSWYVYAFSLTWNPGSSAAGGGLAPNAVRVLTASTNLAYQTLFSPPSTVAQSQIVEMMVNPPMYLFRSPSAANVIINATSSGTIYNFYGWKE